MEKGGDGGDYKSEIRSHGLGIAMAGIFLAGEMAGTGVVKMPHAIGLTSWPGLILLAFMSLNIVYVGRILGICFIIMEERYEAFRGQVRDPYPAIGEAAIGKFGRHASSVCIAVALYGGGCVDLVLISDFLSSLLGRVDVNISKCIWLVIIAAAITPTTWLGTPADLWQIAVGALITTFSACVMVIIQTLLDVNDDAGCHASFNQTTNQTIPFEPEFKEVEVMGVFTAFAAIMFALAGASTFPTIQADMKNRNKFPIAAVLAISILFLMYFPVAAVGFFSLGGSVEHNIVDSLCPGPIEVTVRIFLLLHYITAIPILVNAPNQYFEELLGIPKNFNWKRVVYRTAVMGCLLLIGEIIPDFGAILDLVGASCITFLNLVFPPLFYMRLVDKSKEHKHCKQRTLPIYERVYCWFLALLGFGGACLATYESISNIITSDLSTPFCLGSSDEGNSTTFYL